jgi:hypothetical protein
VRGGCGAALITWWRTGVWAVVGGGRKALLTCMHAHKAQQGVAGWAAGSYLLSMAHMHGLTGGLSQCSLHLRGSMTAQ